MRCEMGKFWKKAGIAMLAGLSTMLVATAQAETPPGLLVVGQSIDDAVSFDPAEGFELTTVQAFNALYQRLVQSNRQEGTRIEPALATSWEVVQRWQEPDFHLGQGRQIRLRQSRPAGRRDFLPRRAVKLNKAPSFILGELGWNADNVDKSITKVDDGKLRLSWQADVGPAFVLAILTAPIASVVDEATVAPQASAGDFGNGWLKSHFGRQRRLQDQHLYRA